MFKFNFYKYYGANKFLGRLPLLITERTEDIEEKIKKSRCILRPQLYFLNFFFVARRKHRWLRGKK